MKLGRPCGVCPERQCSRPTQCGAGRGAVLNDEGIGQWRVRKPAAQPGNAEGAEEGGGRTGEKQEVAAAAGRAAVAAAAAAAGAGEGPPALSPHWEPNK